MIQRRAAQGALFIICFFAISCGSFSSAPPVLPPVPKTVEDIHSATEAFLFLIDKQEERWEVLNRVKLEVNDMKRSPDDLNKFEAIDSKFRNDWSLAHFVADEWKRTGEKPVNFSRVFGALYLSSRIIKSFGETGYLPH